MEAVLAGALRREQEAELSQKRQAAEIEQLTRLVSFNGHHLKTFVYRDEAMTYRKYQMSDSALFFTSEKAMCYTGKAAGG